MIVQYPNTFLETPSRKVEDDEDCSELIEKLRSMVSQLPENCVGLAAPQIGINIQVAIVLGSVVVNPNFQAANQFETGTEGCFSIENGTKFYSVTRPKYGWARWYDPEKKEWIRKKVNGLEARVFQHEIDHLKGKLCHNEM